MVPVRERLLDAGIALLFEDGAKVLGRGLNVADIAARAEVSEKTFFATFGDKGRYVEELLLHLNHPPHHATPDAAQVVRTTVEQAEGDPRRMLRAVCPRDHRQDRGTLGRLAGLVLGRGHRGAANRLRQAYAAHDRVAVQAYRPMLAHWGVALRAPFTLDHLAVAVTALAEGLAQRHLADPDAVPDTLFGDTVVALLGAILDPDQGHGHIDDVIAPFTDRVVHADDALPEHPRNAVLAAARHEFAARGYFATTPAHIAARAAVPVTVLRQLFPAKASLVVGALKGDHAELRSLIDDDFALGVTPVAMVRRHLERLAAFALRNREFAEALLVSVVHDTTTADEISREIDLPALLAPVVSAGQRAGDLHPDLDPGAVAAGLTHGVLLRCFTHRDGDAAGHAAAVGAIALRGLLTRP